MPLRILNEQTGEYDIVPIPTIKGDKGEKGDRGEKGEQGDRGEKSVYVGEEPPAFPEDQQPDVWINPVPKDDSLLQIEDILNDLIRRVTALENKGG